MAGFLALEPGWLDGVSEQVHALIPSYKNPSYLHAWFLKHASQGCQGGRYKLHLLTSDCAAITAASSGYFAVLLEEFLYLDNGYLSRYHHLTQGAHFDHFPCVQHLMQILAIAHFHQVIMRRSVMPAANLHALSHCQGLIPELLRKARPHLLEADHEFWGHFSGDPPWLVQLRQHTQEVCWLTACTILSRASIWTANASPAHHATRLNELAGSARSFGVHAVSVGAGAGRSRRKIRYKVRKKVRKKR